MVIIIGGFALFADNIIKAAIEKFGTAVRGAKVEVEDMVVKWSPISIKFKKIHSSKY